ncbi:hypothetical protein [Polycladidibacter stylochi]|uniref:hypothetical protein n=1 Tax=Polycladidibacter stylochi TaxID=1807766 RepID=UPI00082E215C|nr:hypothetical protein [Pseudovibrio stylochi]
MARTPAKTAKPDEAKQPVLPEGYSAQDARILQREVMIGKLYKVGTLVLINDRGDVKFNAHHDILVLTRELVENWDAAGFTTAYA